MEKTSQLNRLKEGLAGNRGVLILGQHFGRGIELLDVDGFLEENSQSVGDRSGWSVTCERWSTGQEAFDLCPVGPCPLCRVMRQRVRGQPAASYTSWTQSCVTGASFSILTSCITVRGWRARCGADQA